MVFSAALLIIIVISILKDCKKKITITMNKKEFTKLFLTTAGMDCSPESQRDYLKKWWASPFSHSGLRLSYAGVVFLEFVLKLKQYRVDVNADYKETLKFVLTMNKNFSSPFYYYEAAGKKTLVCFGESDASMIILMGGDLATYLTNCAAA